ncbi:MAG: tRNA uridine-5-carboxymethylaminomethyl(34) synthesis GTPase MnmE [Candidatus Omnitrophica bacterium]|nr:tRNA uridine-5-carboxymethylaminomethyl(34) synthesis GTPase MnmE [Candidatus Omnitrophota bacterium]
MTKFRLDDTVCAISTPLGSGGIGVIRLSGPQAFEAAHRFFKPSKETDIRQARSHTLRHGYIIDAGGNKIDEVVAAFYRSPRSYTGEDVVEISGHGSVVTLRKILDLFISHGLRLAERGEFTRRAFLNGKLDLIQAEAVLDIVEAGSEGASCAALSQLEGKFSSVIRSMREKLIQTSAHVEASIDFPEEEIKTNTLAEIKGTLGDVRETIETILASYERGRRLREGTTITIVGKPNVGKSSLLNVLLGKNRAIVSVLPGTTRDAVEEAIYLGGHCVRLVDTAGMGSSDKPLERLAREKTKEYLDKSELFLFVLDGSAVWDSSDMELSALIKDKEFIPVINKIDLPQNLDRARAGHVIAKHDFCLVSAFTKEGIEALEKKIVRCLENNHGKKEEPVWMLRERQKIALEQGRDAIQAAINSITDQAQPELFALDLKQAMERLNELIGEVYTDEVLDKIFSQFCIGK